MKLSLENLPPSLTAHRETLRQCFEAMDREMSIERVFLFGSHARGEAHADSDVDLCLVTTGATDQRKAGNRFYCALRGIWPRPGFSLVPITPERLNEKRAVGDFFYGTVLKEGIELAAQD